ncbi:MAG: endonuclease/exonuclease/phosphatase family protein [Crocinitomicaceae bacterium]|nr:endonuclease/exonuclease/phosphatase family protein [Crocinitomicaceae bacterium]
MRIAPLVLLLPTLLSLSTGCAQKEQNRSIVFYNVENLFDTLDTPDKNDAEFLPDGKNAWNSERYNEKLNHINQVLDEIGNPLIIGLCEIENKAVVRDIVSAGNLKGKYGVVHTESLDKRGIDNAIIYDSTALTLQHSGIIRYEMPGNSGPSRDIVWAKFNDGDESIYALVNHWPSRSGGQVKSEPKRMIAAEAAKDFIDSLLKMDKSTQIVFMGDLNDSQEDMAPLLISSVLTPMITPESGTYEGSYAYRGEWEILDHIMISKGFLKKKGAHIVKDSGTIHSFDFLTTVYKNKIVPFRTYGGGKYLGGYSDHLPVSVEIR